MSWEGIEGHDQIANRFSLAEAAGRIAGSYLFVGQEGIGKATFAKALTMAHPVSLALLWLDQSYCRLLLSCLGLHYSFSLILSSIDLSRNKALKITKHPIKAKA